MIAVTSDRRKRLRSAGSPRTGKSACQAPYTYGYGLDATGKLRGPAAC